MYKASESNDVDILFNVHTLNTRDSDVKSMILSTFSLCVCKA